MVLHRTGDRVVDVHGARYMAERIAGAKLIELPGDDHVPIVGDVDAIFDEIEVFLTGARHDHETDRVLATVLFADIVGSTALAAQLGDRRWGELLQSFYSSARSALAGFRGREIDTAGDGLLASFDGPAPAKSSYRARCGTWWRARAFVSRIEVLMCSGGFRGNGGYLRWKGAPLPETAARSRPAGARAQGVSESKPVR